LTGENQICPSDYSDCCPKSGRSHAAAEGRLQSHDGNQIPLVKWLGYQCLEFADKRSLSDDRDPLKKLDPYLQSLKLDAIDMAALPPFIRDRKLKDGVSNATIIAHSSWFGGY
jgi:hypothetical protein